MWRQLISSADQLRQRVGMALLDFLVVGIDGVNVPWRQFAVAAYVDVLWDGAFGNFRTLLQNISTNVAMGYYLTFAGNRKANPATGAVPDENYARELMQLFTIGLLQLNLTAPLQGGTRAERDLHAGRHHRPRARLHRLEHRPMPDNTHAGPDARCR